MGSQDFINPFVGCNNAFLCGKAFFWIKRHANQNVFTIATYEFGFYDKTDGEVFEDLKAYAKDELGIDLTNILQVERYSFPDGRPDWYGPYGTWAPLQGQNNLWFNGESVAGSGVPTITAFTEFLVGLNFGDIDEHVLDGGEDDDFDEEAKVGTHEDSSSTHIQVRMIVLVVTSSAYFMF